MFQTVQVTAGGTVDRWLEGLLSGDSDVLSEVYSIRSADFNRQVCLLALSTVMQKDPEVFLKLLRHHSSLTIEN